VEVARIDRGIDKFLRVGPIRNFAKLTAIPTAETDQVVLGKIGELLANLTLWQAIVRSQLRNTETNAVIIQSGEPQDFLAKVVYGIHNCS
jgi:hypothetical protein